MPSLPPPSPFQSARTRPLRLFVYREARLALRERILEVGAGEGPVAEEMAARRGGTVFALDRRVPACRPPGVRFVRGDAAALPFGAASFDAVAFHFVLLWLRDPAGALREARRVLRKEGALLLLAEPDLTAREDRPDTGLGEALRRAVFKWGGHPDAGARLEGWLREAGFRPSLRWTTEGWLPLGDFREAAWEILALRRAGLLEREEAARLWEREREAFVGGKREVRLPLAYGTARPR